MSPNTDTLTYYPVPVPGLMAHAKQGCPVCARVMDKVHERALNEDMVRTVELIDTPLGRALINAA